MTTVRMIKLAMLLLLSGNVTMAQTGINSRWHWMHGDYLPNQPGYYAYNPNHPFLMPGARGRVASWQTNNGNFWLYGGQGVDGSSGYGYLSDLWKWTGSQWFFVKGDMIKDVACVFGTQGVAATSNNPGARAGIAYWTDLNGNLWLFGGVGPSPTSWQYRSDLWKFDITAGMWTWMGGCDTTNGTGVYGTQGVAGTGNIPPARATACCWTDNAGNFWMFGGDGPIEALFNDLWKYNPVTNEWTWMKGDQVIFNAGVYGTMGIPDAVNKPGSRTGSSSWKDANGNFWLFGGSGFGDNLMTGGGLLNDLWMYNQATNQWTWRSGNKIIDQATVFGQQGIADPGNKLGVRAGGCAWVDTNGNFWLFGGYGVGVSASYSGYFNDLWQYNPVNNQWIWVKGDQLPNQPGLYNIGMIPGFIEKPGSRSGMAAWISNNTLFFFGGQYWNDVWSISASNLSILPVTVTAFKGWVDRSNVCLTWKTSQEKNFSHFVVQRSFSGFNGNDYSEIARINKYSGTGVEQFYEYTDANVRLEYSGKIYYRLQMVDIDGASAYSRIIVLSTNLPEIQVKVYPNPAKAYVNLVIDGTKKEALEAEILNMDGQLMKKTILNVTTGRNVFTIDVSQLIKTTYLLRLRSPDGIFETKFTKL